MAQNRFKKSKKSSKNSICKQSKQKQSKTKQSIVSSNDISISQEINQESLDYNNFSENEKIQRDINDGNEIYNTNEINDTDELYDEISKFQNVFGRFQYENNIGFVSESMDPEKWIEVDTFIFQYIYKLVCENRIRNVICDYGFSRSFIRLFDFYKNDLLIDNLQQDTDIIQHISQQHDSSINTDIVLAILRESIGFTSYRQSI